MKPIFSNGISKVFKLLVFELVHGFNFGGFNYFYLSGLSIWHNNWQYNIFKVICIILLHNNVSFLTWGLHHSLMTRSELLFDSVTYCISLWTAHTRGFFMMYQRKTYLEIMDFINSRPFVKDDPKYFELRRLHFKSNFYSTMPYVLILQLNVWAFNLIPIIAGKRIFGLPLYYGESIDFDNNALAYYPIYLISVLSLTMTGGLIMNISTFTSSLFNFLANEFKILGLTYDEIFEGKIEEKSFDTIHSLLKRNTIQHKMLLE